MNSETFFLDVNIAMYAAGKPHPLREPCVWVMAEVAQGRIDVAIDVEIIQEILYRFGALRQWSTAVAMAESLMTLVPTILSVNEVDIRPAVELFNQFAPQGVTARDLLHAAVMQNNGLSRIISADSHYDLLPGIERLDPRDLFNQA